MAKVVKAGAVVARTKDGGETYLYRGAEVPDTVGSDEVKRLDELGLLDDAIEIDVAAEPIVTVTAKGK